MPQRVFLVYADTSVFGGILDEEFREVSRAFFQEVRGGRFRLLHSAVVDRELRPAPAEVRRFYEGLLAAAEIVEITVEALELQQAYLAEGILPSSAAMDALHVALATLGRADLIVSWNFKHIVHFDKIRRFNAINRLRGWQTVEIFSPNEVIAYEDEGL